MSGNTRYCISCGSPLDWNDSFCTTCGERAEQAPGQPPVPAAPPPSWKGAIGRERRLSRTALVGIVAGAAALLVLAVLALTVFDVFGLFGAGRPLTAAQLLDLGEKYLLDLDYEQAIVCFEQLIEIEPRNARGYTGLAEAYMALGDTDAAREVLELGLEETGGAWTVQRALDRLDASLAVGGAAPDLTPPTAAPSVTAPSPGMVTPSPTPSVAPTLTPTPTPTPSPSLAPVESGSIQIIDVSPKTVTPGVATAFSVTVRYTSANVGGCIIYAGANTHESRRYRLYDEFVLPDTSGTYTFNFTCTPASWSDSAFGVYVNLSAYPHPDSWIPLDTDEYALGQAAATPTPVETTEMVDYSGYKAILSAPDKYTNMPLYSDSVYGFEKYENFNEYTVYDIDGDGTNELLVHYLPDEAGNTWFVFTISNNAPAYIGSFSGFHSELYKSPDNGLIKIGMHMGNPWVINVQFVNGIFEEHSVNTDTPASTVVNFRNGSLKCTNN